MRSKRVAPGRSHLIFLLGMMFVLGCVFIAFTLLALVFPEFPPSLSPQYSASKNVGHLLTSFFFVALLSAMTMSTLVPFFDCFLMGRFPRPEGRPYVLVRVWPTMPQVALPGFSSFRLVQFAWYSFCVAGLPLSVVGVILVTIWEPNTVSRGLFRTPHTFDAMSRVAVFLLIPAQQLGAGFVASVFRIVPSEFGRTRPEETGEIAARLVLFSGLYNLISLVLFVPWFLMQFVQGAAFFGTLFFCITFLGAAPWLYLIAERQKARIAERLATKYPGT